MNLQKLKSMLPHCKNKETDYVCEACQYGKQVRLPFEKESVRSTHALQLIHTDVWGPTKETSIGGNRYYVTFIDDFTRKVWIYFMKNKSDVFYYFKIFKNQVEKESSANIKILRSKWRENISLSSFQIFCMNVAFVGNTHVGIRPNKMGLQREKIE